MDDNSPVDRGQDGEILMALGETVHTAFRKGCDGKHASAVWLAIKEMPQEQWTGALHWMLHALRATGYDIVKKPELE